MYVPAFSSVSGHNTARNARPKLVERADDGVVVKTYYPRERKAPTWRQQMERQWAAKQAAEQAAERRRIEALDKAIASAMAIESYRVIPVRSVEKVSVRSIIESTAAKHGVSADMILGPRRGRKIVAIRHEAVCAAATLRPDMSLPELGRAFGGRDHTTILHALRKAGIPTSSGARRQHSDRET